jgi:hypothetical protein
MRTEKIGYFLKDNINMTIQENPSRGREATADNVRCSSSPVLLFIDRGQRNLCPV